MKEKTLCSSSARPQDWILLLESDKIIPPAPRANVLFPYNNKPVVDIKGVEEEVVGRLCVGNS